MKIELTKIDETEGIKGSSKFTYKLNATEMGMDQFSMEYKAGCSKILVSFPDRFKTGVDFHEKEFIMDTDDLEKLYKVFKKFIDNS